MIFTTLPSASSLQPPVSTRPLGRIVTIVVILGIMLAGCARDQRHKLVISTTDQKMVLLDKGQVIAIYPVSTSKFGIGDRFGSCATPLGHFCVEKKIGQGVPLGTVFKNRQPTGEVLLPNAPGRDPIVTRILWLKGKESQNKNAFARYIYIHGTPEEILLGQPKSFGCIRMSSLGVAQLYDIVGRGAKVEIIDRPLVKN